MPLSPCILSFVAVTLEKPTYFMYLGVSILNVGIGKFKCMQGLSIKKHSNYLSMIFCLNIDNA